ncbi:unnamed protein product, partial [Ectocarpus sp. 12 AP-2014]
LAGPIPQELGNPPALKHRRLHHDQLSGKLIMFQDEFWNIPKELGALNKLESLDTGSNQLWLWHPLGQDETGSMAAGPGEIN